MAPLRLLELFFDDVLVDMIVCYTRLYSHREKADFSIEITNETIGLFFVAHFRPYQGAKKGKLFASSTKWKLGENFVLLLMKCLFQRLVIIYLWTVISYLFRLLTHLGVNIIWATVVLNKSRLRNGDKQLQNKRNTVTLNSAHQAKSCVYITKPPTPEKQPPTHLEAVHLPFDHRLTKRFSTDQPTTVSLTPVTTNPLTHQTCFKRVTIRQSFHKLISVHSDGMLFLTANY